MNPWYWQYPRTSFDAPTQPAAAPAQVIASELDQDQQPVARRDAFLHESIFDAPIQPAAQVIAGELDRVSQPVADRGFFPPPDATDNWCPSSKDVVVAPFVPTVVILPPPAFRPVTILRDPDTVTVPGMLPPAQKVAAEASMVMPPEVLQPITILRDPDTVVQPPPITAAQIVATQFPVVVPDTMPVLRDFTGWVIFEPTAGAGTPAAVGGDAAFMGMERPHYASDDAPAHFMGEMPPHFASDDAPPHFQDDTPPHQQSP